MKATVSLRPRPVIKRFPDYLDRDEIGIAYDEEKDAFYLCPPDLSSEDRDELMNRWALFLRFVDLIPEFEMDDEWLRGYKEEQKVAFERAKENHDKGDLQPITRTSMGDMRRLNLSTQKSIEMQMKIHALIMIISLAGLLFQRTYFGSFLAILIISFLTIGFLMSQPKTRPM